MPALRPALVILTALGGSAVAALPPQMQAAAIDHGGNAAVITLHTLPVPRPAADEVLIALHTAGVASWDVEVREKPDSIKHSRMPLVLGTDGAGVVAALGAQVHGFKIGEEVYAYSWDNPQGGFYAEYVAVPAERVGHVPQGLTLTQAGAIATTALTALQGVDDALHIKPGETLLIHGAAGGVGTLAVQFAKLRGARVLATVAAADEIAARQGSRRGRRGRRPPRRHHGRRARLRAGGPGRRAGARPGRGAGARHRRPEEGRPRRLPDGCASGPADAPAACPWWPTTPYPARRSTSA